MGPFEAEDLFGKRKGIEHSPHIKAQVELDTKLLWVIGGITLLVAFGDTKQQEQFKAIRQNYREGTKGRFEESDFY